MKKKHLCLLTLIAVSIILIIGGYNIIKGAAKSNIFTAEKINISTSVNNKTKNEINQLCKNSGVFLFNSVEDSETYLIFDGSHLNLNGEVPYFSNIEVEAKGDTILIYYSEELKSYPFGKYPEQKLLYKIKKDKNYDYIKLFKNGEETHFDTIGG